MYVYPSIVHSSASYFRKAGLENEQGFNSWFEIFIHMSEQMDIRTWDWLYTCTHTHGCTQAHWVIHTHTHTHIYVDWQSTDSVVSVRDWCIQYFMIQSGSWRIQVNSECNLLLKSQMQKIIRLTKT